MLSKKGPTLQESLKACWKEGVFANTMLAIFDNYITPLALFLGAQNLHIAFLVAFPQLLGSLSQLIAVDIARKSTSRRNLLINFSIVQASLLVLIAALVYLHSPSKIYVLIFFTVLFRILANYMGLFWGSLVSEYLPPEKRGLYFGWRSQIVGIASLVGVACAGLILHFYQNGTTGKAFFTIFVLASACRFLSCFYFMRMKDSPATFQPEHQFTLTMFLQRSKQSNFVKFTLYVAALVFATYVSAPYFAVYVLRDLKLDYGIYTMIQVAAVIGGLIAFPIWGKHADVVGNAKMLKLSGLLIPLVPLAVLVSPNYYYLTCVEFLGGVLWGGFNLCATNFIYDSVTPQKRIRCLSYFAVINGIAIFLGSSLGGFLIPYLPAVKGHAILSLFLLSAVLRFAAHVLLSYRFNEVRHILRKYSGIRLFFSVAKIRPIVGLSRGWNAMIMLKDFFEKEDGKVETKQN